MVCWPDVRSVAIEGFPSRLTAKDGQAIVKFVATINGQQILVQAVQIAENVFQIGDAWVITR